MIAAFKKITDSGFVRNVATVATGTAAAQAITLAFAPVITRLYGPEAFGLQGLFASLLGLCATLAALGYPTAIVLPRRQQDAVGIAKLSIFIATAFAVLVAILLAVLGDRLLNLLNAQALGPLVYLLPVAMVFSAMSAVLSQWLIRNRAYGITARFQVVTALLMGLAKSGVGLITPGAAALVITNVLGGLMGTLLTFWGWLRWRTADKKVTMSSPSKSMVALAGEYRDFPLFRTPQNFINAVSQSLPVILLTAYFGAASAGQYSIALSLLGVPAALIGGSVMSVFYPRVTEAVHNHENVRGLIIKATLGMMAAGCLPYLLVMAFGPLLLPVIFGDQWSESGRYAQWLAPWLFLQFANRPAVAAIPSLGLQKGLLVYELFSTGSKVVALWVGFVLYESAIVSVALFSLAGIAAYVWLILWVIHSSPKDAGENEKGVIGQ